MRRRAYPLAVTMHLLKRFNHGWTRMGSRLSGWDHAHHLVKGRSRAIPSFIRVHPCPSVVIFSSRLQCQGYAGRAARSARAARRSRPRAERRARNDAPYRFVGSEHLQEFDASRGHERTRPGRADWQFAVSQIGNLQPLDVTDALPTVSRPNSRLATCATSLFVEIFERLGPDRPYPSQPEAKNNVGLCFSKNCANNARDFRT